MPSFPFHIQILIVSATMALHNFVRLNDRDDRGFINANRDSISRREHNSEAGSSYGVFQPRKTWDAPFRTMSLGEALFQLPSPRGMV